MQTRSFPFAFVKFPSEGNSNRFRIKKNANINIRNKLWVRFVYVNIK